MKAETIYKTESTLCLPRAGEKRPGHTLCYEVTRAVTKDGKTTYFISKKRDYPIVPDGFDPQETDANETSIMLTGTSEAKARKIADFLMSQIGLEQIATDPQTRKWQFESHGVADIDTDLPQECGPNSTSCKAYCITEKYGQSIADYLKEIQEEKSSEGEQEK
ncbi:hypothetical protein KY338_05710 [Candidatus Woesearchaeota archaeon]|nr:hypothetical protein [Candidatus Woesearchaeota archaeon]MBW3006442.1 hypothetical protein [Candidatus Woesearchaeota archaeon]